MEKMFVMYKITTAKMSEKKNFHFRKYNSQIYKFDKLCFIFDKNQYIISN